MADDPKPDRESNENEPRPRVLKIFGKEFRLPRSRLLRIVIGVLLVVFGLVGFLPVVGFWMIPLGFLVLSLDNPYLRRVRRKITVWANKRTKKPR